MIEPKDIYPLKCMLDKPKLKPIACKENLLPFYPQWTRWDNYIKPISNKKLKRKIYIQDGVVWTYHTKIANELNIHRKKISFIFSDDAIFKACYYIRYTFKTLAWINRDMLTHATTEKIKTKLKHYYQFIVKKKQTNAEMSKSITNDMIKLDLDYCAQLIKKQQIHVNTQPWCQTYFGSLISGQGNLKQHIHNIIALEALYQKPLNISLNNNQYSNAIITNAANIKEKIQDHLDEFYTKHQHDTYIYIGRC